tara:strand:- start:827 stop:1264 length:438 start_codon:yes stop_codon:yes gene_type:complete
MGIKVSQDLISENHINQEQKLWRHVILNAFEDARLKSTDRKSSLNKLDAHEWINESKDFDQICWWAGWDPDEVRIRYRKALKNLEIKFNIKHIKWREYYDMYNKLKFEIDKDKRRELRKTVEKKRREVFDCESIVMTTFFITVKA